MASTSKKTEKSPQKRQNANHSVILYPGIVKNADKAIESLGGHAKIQQSHFTSRPLDLSHRPTNMYHRPVQSDRKTGDEIGVGSMFLVVKVRRKKPKAPGDQPGPSQAEIVGPVATYHSFKSMCDFQYLPLQKREQDGEIEAIASELIPTDIPSALTWWDKKGSTDTSKEPLFLPPFQFSRLMTPSPYMLCRETEARDAKMEGKLKAPGQSLRLERKALSITVNGDEHFPDIPSEEAVNDANARCRDDEPHRKMKELFEERPVWTRQAISCKTGLEDQVTKILMSKYAFYIQSGPWGRLWCRFGYDPRKDPDSRQYQTVMVSFRRHKKIPERPRLKMMDKWSNKTSGGRQKAESSEIDPTTAYKYTPGQLPSIRQMWYSLCDIGLQIAADYLTLVYEPPGNVADAQHGWLPSEALDTIRNEIKNDVKRTSKLIDAVEADEMGEEDDEIDDWLD